MVKIAIKITLPEQIVVGAIQMLGNVTQIVALLIAATVVG